MSHLRRCVWLVLLHRVITVSCLVRVEGPAGEAVLLPCVYAEPEPLPATVTALWRDKDDNVVLDIINGRPDAPTQHPNFRGRVTSFPPLYSKGNFSISLQDARRSDSGRYECHIPAVDFQHQVQLDVSGKRVGVATPPPPVGDAAVTPAPVLTLLSVLLLCTLQ